LSRYRLAFILVLSRCRLALIIVAVSRWLSLPTRLSIVDAVVDCRFAVLIHHSSH
jgi:hypothetical protein